MWWIYGSAPLLDWIPYIYCIRPPPPAHHQQTNSFFFSAYLPPLLNSSLANCRIYSLTLHYFTRRDQSPTKSSTMDFQPSCVGYGFHPTDEELVNYYLRLKMHGGYEQDVSLIEEVNVCDYEPWALPGLLGNQDPNDPECYFFSPRSYKYANSHRANRKTEGGYWKVTGKDRIVKAKATKEHIATKKTLVFYTGSVPNGVRTNWIMHEYHPTFTSHYQREFVLCKLKKDPEAIMPTYEEGESSSNVTSHHLENQNSNEYNHPRNFGEGGYGAPMPSYFTTNEQEEDISQIQLYLNSFRNYDGMGDYNLDAALQDPYYGDM